MRNIIPPFARSGFIKVFTFSGEKIPTSGKDFAQISPDGYWHAVLDDSGIANGYKYLCRQPRTNYGYPRPACPVGSYVGSNFACYTVVFAKQTWQKARDECVFRGGDLTSVHNTTDNIWLSIFMTDRKWTFWIGLTFNASDGWTWSDNTLFNYDSLDCTLYTHGYRRIIEDNSQVVTRRPVCSIKILGLCPRCMAKSSVIQ